ncbi:MAG TPA: hypothetical protein VJ921_10525 [Vicinamibacteria bacterium]|nr:hypothetical protein [Vicinamibacteria bacterium]
MIAMRERLKGPGRTLSLLALLVSVTPGCITEPDTLTDDSTNAIIQIVSMAGNSGEPDGQSETGTDVFSDVCFANETIPPCSTFNDNGVVTMRAFPKDRGQPSSQINDVTFERYRVTYVRADGRNVQGIDVPYAFDGVANFTVPITGDEVERGFLLVRHQAKAESPLRELARGGSQILTVIAQIDFYGRDSAGRAIQATGYLNVTFADFGNE